MLAVALSACREQPRRAVERVAVTESAAGQALERAGVPAEALGKTASRLFDAAPGFAPASSAGERARRLLARVSVDGAEILASGSPGGTVARVVITVELTSAEGDPALRETGQATAVVGTAPGALRGALERAAAAAVERAVDAFSLEFAAEEKKTPELVKDLSSAEAPVRDHAVRVLADRGRREAVPALLARLHDPDPDVAERAVGALAQLHDPRAVPALIQLARHRDGAYVANLAHVVGDIGGSDAKAWLLTLASGHPEQLVRGAAREALAEMSVRAAHARAEP